MSEVIPDRLLPPNTQFEWAELDGERVVNAIHVEDGRGGGIFVVRHHVLPPRLETPTILRAAGMELPDVAAAMHFFPDYPKQRMYGAPAALGTPATIPHKRRFLATVSRLFLPDSVLEVARPLSFPTEPDELSLRAAELLGQGRPWAEIEDQCGMTGQGIRYNIRKWYLLQGGKVAAAPLLFHLLGGNRLDPEVLVAGQSTQSPSEAETVDSPPSVDLQRVLPKHLWPPHTEFVWGSYEGHTVIDAIQVRDGKLKVRHGVIPPGVETPLLLRIAGATAQAAARTSHHAPTPLRKHLRTVQDKIGTPELRSDDQMHATNKRLYATIARLFLRGSVLEIVQPISFPAKPSERDLELLGFLGQGNSWIETRGQGQRQKNVHNRIQSWYTLQPHSLLIAPWLLHAYWSGLIEPEAVVAEQERHKKARQFIAFNSAAASINHEKATNTFALIPFDDDPQTRIHIHRNTSQIVAVETYEGASFAVADTTHIITADEQRLPITEEEKLALILFAVGATYDEVKERQLKPSKLNKFGITSNLSCARQATKIACRNLLIPKTAPRLSFSPQFMEIAKLLHQEDTYKELAKSQNISLSAFSDRIRTLTLNYELRSSNLIMTIAHALEG